MVIHVSGIPLTRLLFVEPNLSGLVGVLGTLKVFPERV